MHLFIISFYIPLHVSSHIVLIIRRIDCIYTASGSLCVTLLVWSFGAQEVRGLACAPNDHTRRVTHKEPDAVYIQKILLMMSTIWLETCRGIWKDIINKCIRLETRNEIWCEVRKSCGPQVRPLHIADSAQIISAVEVRYSKQSTGSRRVLPVPLIIVTVNEICLSNKSGSSCNIKSLLCHLCGTLKHSEVEKDSNWMQAKCWEH